GHRVRDVRRVEEESALVAHALDLLGDERCGERQSGAERLRQCQHVGDYSMVLEGEEPPGAPESRLRLVEHEQRSPFGALRLQGSQIALREIEDAAGAENRLCDEGGELTAALPVDELEPVVELGSPVERPVGVAKARTVRVR